MMQNDREARRALTLIPGGTFIMTAACDGKRAGMLVRSVQPCATEPPLICIAARKGHTIDLIIRDSHHFAICQVDPADRLLLRRFMSRHAPESPADPFIGLDVERLASGAPVLRRSPLALDCEVFRQYDLEADHELFIGLILAAKFDSDEP